MSRFVTPIAAVVPLRRVLNNPPLQERKAEGQTIATHRPSGLIPRPEPRCVRSLLAEPQPPGFTEPFIHGPSCRMCFRGHIPPAWLWLIIFGKFRSVDGRNASKNIFRAGSTAPPLLVGDDRKLLPTAFTRLVRVHGLRSHPNAVFRRPYIDAGILVMPNGGVCGIVCPLYGVINHRPLPNASLTRGVACGP